MRFVPKLPVVTVVTAMGTGETMRTTPARVAMIDDHPLFRAGLRTMFDHDPKLSVAIDTGSPREALEQAEAESLDVLVVDLVLPEISGVEVIGLFKRIQPTCHVLALSMIDQPVRIAEALRAGALGFAHKGQPPSEILEAVHCVLGQVRYLPPSVRADDVDQLLATEWLLDRLTTREREVFALLVDGCSNDEIATRLFIARRTVETHRNHVMHKLNARNVVDLVRLAYRHGVAVA